MKYKVFVDITVSKIICDIEAESGEQAQAIALERVKNEPYYYAAHADGFVKAEVDDWDEDEDEDSETQYSEDYRKGIAYVKEQLDEFEKDIIRAKVSKNYQQHNAPSTGIDDHKVIDLLEEYGGDNDLGEGWYLDEYDADDVMLML